MYFITFTPNFSSSVTAPQHSGFVLYRHTHGSHFTGGRIKLSLIIIMPLAFAFSTERVPVHGDEHSLLFSYNIFWVFPQYTSFHL